MKRSLFLFLRSAIILFLVAEAGPATGQNYLRHNWYFGNSSLGIRFNRADHSPSLVTNKATPFNMGGSAVATDPVNGDLLFYTDGISIYDATHSVMPAGTGLGANADGNQPVAIAKAPGQTTQYYVFTNTADFTTGGSISFRIVDMSLPGNATLPTPPMGDALAAANTPVPGLTGMSEAMITIPHANGEDFWLITHANGTPDYSVTLFDATGPASTNLFAGVGLIQVAGNLAWHEPSGRVAVTTQEATRDIEIIGFDNTNGVITFDQRILNTGVAATAGEAIYDTEWSASGQYLYISRHGEAGITADVLQADLVNTFSTLTTVLPQPVFRSYGLQMAPDSLIYHLYQEASGGPYLLGFLADTDTIASAVDYSPDAFASDPDFNGRQFPSFAPKDSIMLDVSFTSTGTCANSPVSFYPTVTPGADSLVWDFGDGNGAFGWSPVHTYTAGGAFDVQVIAFLNGDTATAIQTLNITQFDLQLTLVQDTTACACELPVNNGQPMANGALCPDDTSDDMVVTVQAQGGTPSYQWFGPGGILPLQTTADLRPDSAGYYYVVATDMATGCSAYAGVNIKEYDSLNQQANIWHFGHLAGIDFNGLPDDPPVPIMGPLDTPEGTSVISDRNGQVILSTDGRNIFVPDGAGGFTDITPAPNPPGLGGDPESTQSALIVPVPGDETLFYIFTTQAVDIIGGGNFELRYSLFDLKAFNNGVSGLVQFNQPLFSRSTERITSNGNWLIAHEFGNNSFRAYPVSSLGIGNPVISAIGSDHTLAVTQHGQGYMEIGAQSRLAVALSTPGVSNVVEIFDFIDSTGVVTNFRTADLGSATGEVYGLEISPGGNKLFATLKDASSDIYEFAFDTLGNPYLKQQVTIGETLGAMQIGPDGQIYVARDGNTVLGTFSAIEDTTQVSNLALQDFGLLPGTNSELGLPNFTQVISNPLQTPGLSAANFCLGDSTQFSATGKDPAIDKFDWTFGDGTGQLDGGAQINHLYGSAGTYIVNVRIYNKCEEVGVFTTTVVINDLPPDPSAGVNMCTGDALLDANPQNIPGFSFVWSTGDTTRTVTVSEQAIYTVTISDPQGCSTDATFLVADNRPQFDFGPDLTVCQNTTLAPLDAQNPGATYSWTLNGAPTGATSQTFSVDTSVPGSFEYIAEVTDPFTTCFARDTITYTINESPGWNAVPFNPTACGAADGRIELTINSPAATLFTYFITGPATTLSDTDQSPGAVITTPSTLGAGTYGVTVTDQVSGCATINTVNINDPGFTLTGVPTATCDPIMIEVTVDPVPGPFGPDLSYRVIDNATATAVEGPTNLTGVTTTFTTALPLASNNQQYTVEVTSNGCTVSSPPVTIDESPSVAATLSADPCSDPITVTASGGTGWTWTGPAITSATNLAAISATPPQGSHTYNVTITEAGFCDLDTAIVVNVNNDVDADFTQSDACEDQVTLSATPDGTYTYRWYRNGAMIPGGGGQQIIVGLADDQIQYRVEVVNTVSGCVFSSAPKTVNVAGDVRVTLQSTLPCEGSPFTLTAVPNPTTITTFVWTRDGTALPETSSVLTETLGGEYVVSVTQSGCTVTDEMNIVLAPVTAGLLTDTYIICPDPANPDPTTREVELDPGPGFLRYEWFMEQSPLGVTSRTYTATAAGEYSVNLINSYGCASSDRTELVEECDPRISGPNAFRPGGLNKEFFLFTFFIDDTDFQVFIFNRWGEMVYQSNARDFKWNGSYNNNPGQPLPAGTYSYVVKYKSSYRPEEGVREKRGGVVLLR